MPCAWFLAPYRRRPGAEVVRYCAVDDFTALISSDGGGWAEAECLGGYAVAKVCASAATLQAINAEPGFIGVPVGRLDDPLSSLTAGQRSALAAKVQELGYSADELRDALGSDIGQHTLGDLLRFVLRRRRRPRYDADTDEIVLDGPVEPTGRVEDIDAGVG